MVYKKRKYKMSKNIFYHNPRCRKSRETLKIVQEKKAEIELVEYLNNPPNKKQMKLILKGLGKKPLEIIRTQEKVFKNLKLSKKDDRSDDDWIDIMIKNPILIERPIFIYNNKVVLGRPPENVLKIL
jgi:arsenate reductase